jgi:short-subunit dehydrogenase
VDLRPLTVVTGGSAGIGGALTRRLAARGERILITGRDPARLARMAEGTGAETLRVDLLDEDGLEILLRRLRGEPEIGLLVNNAGAPFRRPLLDHHAGEAERAVRLLYLAMIETTGAAWAGLVRGGGSIVNVVSVAGSVSTGSAPRRGGRGRGSRPDGEPRPRGDDRLSPRSSALSSGAATTRDR